MRLKLAALAAAVSLLAVSQAAAQEVVLKFGHAAASNHLFNDGLEMFAEAVDEKTGGRVKIEIFGDRQLGDDKQLLEGVQLGTVDGALVSVPTMPLVGAGAFDALQIPFVVGTYEEMSAALTSPVGQQLLDSLASLNIKGLGYYEAGQRHFLSRTRAVENVDDFAGLKTRIVPTPLHRATWEAVGTNPIGMAYGEIYSGLETGTIDAVEINLSSAQSESYYQAAKYATLTGHYFWPGVLMMGSARFDALPDDIKTALVEAGAETIVAHYELAASQEAETADFLKQNGVTITELQDLDAMREKVKPVVDEWVAKDPLIQAFVDQVESARQ
ncbi:TRAP transporter substrate-binding protein [Mesorhizobium sp. CAU 1741]|uniref:TRAP transporter substrate-binding protein n=1 Tax=Mesorhizobium sp. CAU 1741 TaxID=3140366 RepID=UPI00325ADEF7